MNQDGVLVDAPGLLKPPELPQKSAPRRQGPRFLIVLPELPGQTDGLADRRFRILEAGLALEAGPQPAECPQLEQGVAAALGDLEGLRQR